VASGSASGKGGAAGAGASAGFGATDGAAGAATDAPHNLQNFATLLLGVPHSPQIRSATATLGALLARRVKFCPQFLQNFAPSLFSTAHFGHLMLMFHPSEALRLQQNSAACASGV
jgi:hypothetical protein